MKRRLRSRNKAGPPDILRITGTGKQQFRSGYPKDAAVIGDRLFGNTRLFI